MGKYILGASTDIGFERESQEDFIQFKELDSNNLIAVVADGTGSVKGHLQPAVMVALSIIQEIYDIYLENKDYIRLYPKLVLKRALINANSVLGAYKLGNEEILSGYATSVTAALFTEDDKVYIAHCGNTRLYVIRNSNIIQLTKDDTEAQLKLEEGEIDEVTYHVHPGRLKLMSGIGLTTYPNINVFHGKLNTNDLILMTTDGIHYAIKPEHMMNLVLEAQDVVPACNNLIYAAKEIVKYPDNMSAIVIGFNNK